MLGDRLRDRIDARREDRHSPEREELRAQRRARRQRIVDRLAQLAGIVGGQLTGANWIGKAVALAIVSFAIAILKSLFWH